MARPGKAVLQAYSRISDPGGGALGRIAWGLVGLVVGYLLGAGAGAMLVQAFSLNAHDKSVELAMTSLLVAGPIGAVIGLVAGLVKGGGKKT